MEGDDRGSHGHIVELIPLVGTAYDRNVINARWSGLLAGTSVLILGKPYSSLEFDPADSGLFRKRERCALSYAGDITCVDCWNILENDPCSQLIDVRTQAEWNFVGFPVLEQIGKKLVLAEWQQFPTMQINPEFVSQSSATLQSVGSEPDSQIFTLCRSGVRSIAAAEALTEAGYKNVYNVLAGFEGTPNETGHRGMVSGWKFDGLPWAQR